MSLHDKILSGTEKHLMMQRRDEASKPLPDTKAQEEKENKEINFINDLSPRDSGLAAGRPPLPPHTQLATPELEPIEPTAQPCMKKDGPPLKDPSGYPVWPGNLCI